MRCTAQLTPHKLLGRAGGWPRLRPCMSLFPPGFGGDAFALLQPVGRVSWDGGQRETSCFGGTMSGTSYVWASNTTQP